MYKNNSLNYREGLNQYIKLNRDNTEKLKIQLAKRNNRVSHTCGNISVMTISLRQTM